MKKVLHYKFDRKKEISTHPARYFVHTHPRELLREDQKKPNETFFLWE